MLSLEIVKTFLAIDSENLEFDDLLAEDILLVTDAINLYCARTLNLANHNLQILLREAESTIFIPNYPLKEVDSVTVDGLDQVYSFLGNGTLLAKSSFPKGTLEINYESGYDEADLPPILKNVFLGIMKKRHTRRVDGVDVDDTEDVSSIAITGVMSVKYNNSKDNSENIYLEGYERILDRFKLVQV